VTPQDDTQYSYHSAVTGATPHNTGEQGGGRPLLHKGQEGWSGTFSTWSPERLFFGLVSRAKQRRFFWVVKNIVHENLHRKNGTAQNVAIKQMKNEKNHRHSVLEKSRKFLVS